MSGLAGELASAYAEPGFDNHLEKLARSGFNERHLFVPIHYTGLSFATSYGLIRSTVLPTDPPPADTRVSGLWLVGQFGSTGIRWNGVTWTRFTV